MFVLVLVSSVGGGMQLRCMLPRLIFIYISPYNAPPSPFPVYWKEGDGAETRPLGLESGLRTLSAPWKWMHSPLRAILYLRGAVSVRH